MPAKYTPEKRAAAFWSKVDKSDAPDACWPWIANRHPQRGYGRVRWNTKWIHAHRAAFELAYGAAPGALEVCHTCDNPPCCNPTHLFLGTHLDNMQDRERKGRGNQPSGEQHAHYKLTDNQVAEIRRRYADGIINQTALAKEYGVWQTTISYIVREKWRRSGN